MTSLTSLLYSTFICIYVGILLRLCWVDFKFQLLPDNLTYSLLWTGLVFQIALYPAQLPSAVFGAIGGYVSLWSLYWLYFFIRKIEGIGYGDMKLLAALGAWHGWENLHWIVLTASGCGLLLVGFICLRRRWNITLTTTPLPFGPCLAIAGGVTGWCNNSLSILNNVNFLL